MRIDRLTRIDQNQSNMLSSQCLLKKNYFKYLFELNYVFTGYSGCLRMFGSYLASVLLSQSGEPTLSPQN